MITEKANLFADDERLDPDYAYYTKDPQEQRKPVRHACNFDIAVWEKRMRRRRLRGSYAKSSQNREMG